MLVCLSVRLCQKRPQKQLSEAFYGSRNFFFYIFFLVQGVVGVGWVDHNERNHAKKFIPYSKKYNLKLLNAMQCKYMLNLV